MVRKREVLGRMQLIISSFIWGTSYLFTKTVQQYIPPFYLMAFRLSFACILLMMIGARQLKRINPGVIWRGAVMGICLFGGLGLQSIGINSISPGTSAFLSASYCVFLPFLYWIFTRRRPEWSQFAGVILCMTGIGLVSLREGFTVAAADLITVASGLLYAGQMLSAAIFVKKNDPFLLSLVQLMTAAVLSWIVAVSAGPFPAGGSSVADSISRRILYRDRIYIAEFRTNGRVAHCGGGDSFNGSGICGIGINAVW